MAFLRLPKGRVTPANVTNLRFRTRWPPCTCTAEPSPALGFHDEVLDDLSGSDWERNPQNLGEAGPAKTARLGRES